MRSIIVYHQGNKRQIVDLLIIEVEVIVDLLVIEVEVICHETTFNVNKQKKIFNVIKMTFYMDASYLPRKIIVLPIHPMRPLIMLWTPKSNIDGEDAVKLSLRTVFGEIIMNIWIKFHLQLLSIRFDPFLNIDIFLMMNKWASIIAIHSFSLKSKETIPTVLSLQRHRISDCSRVTICL